MNFGWCQSLSRKHTLLDSGSAEERENQCTVKDVLLRAKASFSLTNKIIPIEKHNISHLDSFHTRWII